MRTGLTIFFRKVFFTNKKLLYEKGPLLLACNHPNSFLDALILGASFKHPVHFLARGDVFKHPLAKAILTKLKVIPIYRLSEGKEYLALNDTTFQKCTGILRDGGIVLIFSEGLCINQWKLRQLKKGTPRIALNAWTEPAVSASFRILPVSLNYSSFSSFRKNVIIDFGKTIQRADIDVAKPEGEQIIELNKLIRRRLEKGLIIEDNDRTNLEFLLNNISIIKKNGGDTIPTLKRFQSALPNYFQQYFDRLIGTKKVAITGVSTIKCYLLISIFFLPAIVGFLVHVPLYLPLRNILKRKTAGTVFFHSALFGVLIFLYPLYALLLSTVVVIATGNIIYLVTLIILPLLAILFLVWKDWTEALINHHKLSTSIRKQLSKCLETAEGAPR